MKKPHINEFYSCFLFILLSKRDFTGIVKADTIKQFAIGHFENMKKQGRTLGNMDRANEYSMDEEN